MKIYQSIDGSDSFKSLKILNAGSIDSENKIITPIGEARAYQIYLFLGKIQL